MKMDKKKIFINNYLNNIENYLIYILMKMEY